MRRGRARHGGRAAHLVHEQAVDDGRQHLVALADDHRGAEVGERREEDEQRAAEDRREQDRRGHRPEDAPPARAEPGGGLLERVVHGPEAAQQDEEDERVEVQRQRQHDPVHPVDGGEPDPPGLERLGDVAGAARAGGSTSRRR